MFAPTRRYLDLAITLAILFVGLYVFHHTKFIVLNFKPYHLGAYWTLIADRHTNKQFNSERAQGVPVLLFHGVLPDKDFENSNESTLETNTPLSRFREQLYALKRDGWNTVTLADFQDYISGKKDLPRKSFLLTFDDGRKDSFYPVDPILHALDYHAVLFIITDKTLNHSYSEGSFYLSKEELEHMIETGRWDIAAHASHEHTYITTSPENGTGVALANRIWKEDQGNYEADSEYKDRVLVAMTDAKTAIQEKLGLTVSDYAFPYGNYGQRDSNYVEAEQIIRSAVEQVFSRSYYQISPDSGLDFYNYPGQRNTGFVARVKAYSGFSGDYLVSILNKAEPIPLPFAYKTPEQFVGNWASVSGSIDVLDIAAKNENTSAFATIRNSSRWRDYKFVARVDEFNGQAVSLISYFVNDRSYFACTFTSGYLRIQKKQEERLVTIKEIKIQTDQLLSSDLMMGINSDRKIVCSFGGNGIISDEVVATDESAGSAGISIWGEKPGFASAKISNIQASSGYIGNEVHIITPDEINQALVPADKILVAEKPSLLESGVEQSLPFVVTDWSVFSGTWGGVYPDKDGLHVFANDESTGALAVLLGTKEWENYRLTYDLKWKSGSNVVLVTRYQDNANYLALNIHDDYIRVEEYLNGRKSVIDEFVRDYADPEDRGNYATSIKVSIRQEDSKTTFFINDSKKLQVNRSLRLPKSGLVGIKVWDKTDAKASVVLTGFRADTI